MYRDYDRNLISNARRLRKNMTHQERRLWYCFLRGYEKKFLRQRSVGRYILDFYCAAAKLAVEVDGGQHYDVSAQAQDQVRTAFLEGLGIRVIRFTNTQIDREYRAVCEEIHRMCQ